MDDRKSYINNKKGDTVDKKLCIWWKIIYKVYDRIIFKKYVFINL